MSYTPTNTFADDTLTSATDIRKNFIDLTSYINQGIALADIENSSIDTQHIIRGKYEIISGGYMTHIGYLETGTMGMHKLEPIASSIRDNVMNISYTKNGFIAKPYQNSTTDITLWKNVAKTGISFYIEKASVAHIYYSGEIICPDDMQSPDKQVNQACLAIDSVPHPESMFFWKECYSGATPTYDLERRSFQTKIQIGLAQGWHHASIVCGLASNFALVGGVTAVIDSFNISNT